MTYNRVFRQKTNLVISTEKTIREFVRRWRPQLACVDGITSIEFHNPNTFKLNNNPINTRFMFMFLSILKSKINTIINIQEKPITIFILLNNGGMGGGSDYCFIVCSDSPIQFPPETTHFPVTSKDELFSIIDLVITHST